MPTYVYECAKCGDEFELWQSFSDEPLKKHPDCGGKVIKVLQPVGIVLKGSGFYRTDNRSSSGRSAKSDGADKGADKAVKSDSSSGSGDSSTKSDTKKSDSKTTDTKKSETKQSSSSTS